MWKRVLTLCFVNVDAFLSFDPKAPGESRFVDEDMNRVWVEERLDGDEQTCIWTTDKIKAIRELMQHTSQYMQKQLPKTYSWELVEVLFKQPYCRINNLVSARVAKRQTASVYLKQLCDIGVLREVKSGRETLFVHPKYIELLTGEENVWIYYAGVETDNAVAAAASN